MKKIFLIVFTVFTSFIASAQKIHFTDTSNVWYQFFDQYNDGNPPIFTYTTYHFVNDTIIHSIDYKIFSFGAVREDTLSKKVYLRDVLGDSDVLLMDYNLGIGDTFTTNYDTLFHIYYKYVVTSIDSTLINGVWHKHWHFPAVHNPQGTSWESDIIEGIGCIQHPTYMIWHGIGVEPIDPRVYCFSNKSMTPPVSPRVGWLDNSTSCTTYPHLNTNDLRSKKSKVTIYPNPTTTSLTITSPSPITTLSITNLLGQVVFTHHYNTDQVHIDVADLPKGLYFVRVNDREVRKFLKE
jgi:hypothetical protein